MKEQYLELNENPKITRRNGHICTCAALLISITAGVCATLGVRSIFGGGIIILCIAAFIEVCRVTSIIMLNKYFEYIKGALRWCGLTFVSIACLFSMWSVSGYFLEQYHKISQDSTMLTFDTNAKSQQINDLQDNNKLMQEQLVDLRKSLEQKRNDYSLLKPKEDGSLTVQQNRLNNEINSINRQINDLTNQLKKNNEQISLYRTDVASLNKETAEKSPEIQRLKPFAKMFGISNESTIVMCIIILLTIIFDPFAIFLIFWGNRILKLADKNEQILKKSAEKDTFEVDPVKPIVKKSRKKSTKKKQDKKLPIETTETEKTEQPEIKSKEVEKPVVNTSEQIQIEPTVKSKPVKTANSLKYSKTILNPTEEEPIVKKVKNT